MPKKLRWNEAKNDSLKKRRDISFEEMAAQINAGAILETLEHPNQEKYPNQKIFVNRLHNYVWLVPFVETATEIFLKTIIPSRKATRDYETK